MGGRARGGGAAGGAPPPPATRAESEISLAFADAASRVTMFLGTALASADDWRRDLFSMGGAGG
jgi:hypothetical protein